MNTKLDDISFTFLGRKKYGTSITAEDISTLIVAKSIKPDKIVACLNA